MNEPSLRWHPANSVPLATIEQIVSPLVVGRGGVTIMKNGTLLFLKKAADDAASAALVMNEARFLTDFRVKELSDGDYIVALNGTVGVFVGRDEFLAQKPLIQKDIEKLKFPSEELLVPPGWTEEQFLVGLYGRAKLRGDIEAPEIYKRVD